MSLRGGSATVKYLFGHRELSYAEAQAERRRAVRVLEVADFQGETFPLRATPPLPVAIIPPRP